LDGFCDLIRRVRIAQDQQYRFVLRSFDVEMESTTLAVKREVGGKIRVASLLWETPRCFYGVKCWKPQFLFEKSCISRELEQTGARMALPKFPVEGGCQCGAVRYRLKAAPLTVYNCHCKDCQRFSGAACSISMVVRNEDFEVLSGQTVRYDRKAESGNVTAANFCAHCYENGELMRGMLRPRRR
jgi:hypothetical protein